MLHQYDCNIRSAKLIKFAYLQTIHNMETRVLTLFDDEEFFPKEEPKKKPKKEPKVNELAHNEESGIPETNTEPFVTDNQTSAHSVYPESLPPESLEEIEANPEHELIDEPKNKVPEVELIEEPASWGQGASQAPEETDEEPIVEADENQDVYDDNEAASADQEKEPEEAEPNVASADEELNKQILSELIQMDYTALIHRDYPFDVNKASVVEKKEQAKTDLTHDQETNNESEEDEDNEVFEDIVPLPEWNLDKKYYTIGEVAQLFAVNTSHIRFWTNEFKLKPRTTRKGDRLYNPKDIAELRLIHHLVKEKKHTIKGAKEKLKAGKNEVNNKLDLKDSLINLRDTLLQIKAQL